MTSPVSRARWLGLGLVGLAFGAGLLSGLALGRRPADGVQITVTATDRIPRELERLGLSDPQRDAIRAALARGRPRVFRVLREFDPRMQAALDSTEAEVATILDSAQRTRWEAERRERMRRDTVIIQDGPGR
ncbi:MAG: hypothetical protein SFV24_08380 [Gemmatimonadales bacterium]|nr:hypothetical protein [Gemmatimonadales bacterium]